MNELQMQQLLIDAAQHVGGNGIKCNNRFLVGVVDLLISIPEHRPMWLEVKKQDFAASTLEGLNRGWGLDVTKKQKDHLRDWRAAGMLTGVASFVQVKGQGIKGLRLALYPTSVVAANGWCAFTMDHEHIGDHNNRLQTMADMLMEFSK